MDLMNDLKNGLGAIKDSISEGAHKGAADAEHAKRDVAGDSLTTGEKVSSIANEAKNNVQAGVDHAKVEARKEI
jgi:hypothetical protein